MGFSLNELSEKADSPDVDLLSLGLLDVTQAPYNADTSGATVCTAALQQAIIDARTRKLVCFFPSGDYLIDDTLSCEIPVYKLPTAEMPGKLEDACGKYQDGDGKTQHYWASSKDKIVLLGSTKGKRPVIHLKPGSVGFGSSSSPKYAIKIWAQTRDDRGGAVNPADPCLHATPIWGKEQPSICFNNAFKGIDIELGGNAGAVGLRFSGSQGCYLMDSKVFATNAHAGFTNCPGQGGGTYNLEVEGGQYGIKIENYYRFPLLAACVLKGQTKACIYSDDNDLPIIMAGCYFEPATGSAIDLTSAMQTVGGISLADCVAKVSQAGPLVKTKSGGENIFLENFYLKGFNQMNTADSTVLNTTKWIHVSEYSFCKGTAKNLINGVATNATRFNWAESTEPDYSQLYGKHWTNLPSFEDADAVNVKDFGAKGDNIADDTKAFKDALAASNKVFVPKGTYKVSETLVVGANQQLFGNPKVYTGITAAITTVDDPDASLTLAFITPNSISWKAGKGIYMFCDGSFAFSGNGGGRFYGLDRMSILGGNKAPVSIYSYNVERVTKNPMFEIKNASNIKIFYFKCEAGTTNSGNGNDYNTPLKISDSQNIRIYGVSGVTKTKEDRPMVDVVNSTDIMVAVVKSLDSSSTSAPTIRETIGSNSVEIPRNTVASLYMRTQPTEAKNIDNLQPKVYPNSFTNSFTIEVPDGYNSIQIHDIEGKRLFDRSLSGASKFNVEELANQVAGVYFVSFIALDHKQIIKVLKK
jgi:hypothetical protein